MKTILALLGKPHIEQSGASIHLPTKAIALLGYLAIQRLPQRREHILALLWPESSEEAARKNGRNTLWTIRRSLGAEIIRSTDDQLALDPTIDIDLWSWEAQLKTQPETVIDLYRGPFLDGVQLSQAGDFDVWLMVERERLAQMHMRVLQTVVDQHAARGNWDIMRQYAQQALHIDILQEPMYRALMIAHAQLGERQEALRQYELLSNVLEHELGVEPLPETNEIFEAIRQGQLTGSKPAAQSSEIHDAHPEAQPELPFIGRLAETQFLDRAWQTSFQQPQISLLTGEIGIGKTRLMREWRAQLPQNTTTMWMRCLQTTQHLPFSPLINILQTETCLSQIQTRVSPIWLTELGRLIPNIHEYIKELPSAPSLPADEERLRIFEAFLQIFKAFPQPRAWFIDDLQWLDSASAAWLDYVTERIDEQIMIIASYRSEEASPHLQKIITSWSRRSIMERSKLEPLNQAEALLLSQKLGLQAQRIDHIIHQSGGNPFFLIEISKVKDEQFTQALVDIIAERLDQLPGAAQQVVQAAAVLDPGFSVATLRKTAGRSEEETLDGIDALIQGRILKENDQELTFAHPLIATVVEHQMSNARRRFLHSRAASILEQSHRQQIEYIAGRLVAHHYQAGDAYRAAEYADLAAAHAQRVAAPEEALIFRQQAVAYAPSPIRQRELGKAYLWLGQLQSARSEFQSALSAFQSGELWHEIARIQLLIAETYLPQTAVAESIEAAERAAEALQHCQAPELEASTELLLGTAHRMISQSSKRAEQHIRRAQIIAEQHQLPQLLARIAFEQGNILNQRGTFRESIESFRQSIQLAQQSQDIFQEVLSHNNLAYTAILANQLELAEQHLAQGKQLTAMWSLYIPTQYLWSTEGELQLARGATDAAETAFNRGLAVAQQQHNQIQVINYQANLALVEQQRGYLPSALHLLEQSHHQLEQLTAPFLKRQIELWMLKLYLQQNQLEAANSLRSQLEIFFQHNEHGYLEQQLEQVVMGQQNQAI